jgi:hypothetical protein
MQFEYLAYDLLMKKLLTKIKPSLFIGPARFLLRKYYETTFIWSMHFDEECSSQT